MKDWRNDFWLPLIAGNFVGNVVTWWVLDNLKHGLYMGAVCVCLLVLFRGILSFRKAQP